jgi:DNA-binding NarL/FixJ family response regulator
VAVHVAVVDPLPMFRQGVVAVLAPAGYVVDTPLDILRWTGRRRSACVLLSVRADVEWALLRSLSAKPSAAVIALLDDTSAAAGARAVRAGARSVLPRSVASGVLRRTVEATVDGQSVLPPEVTMLLAAAAPPDTPLTYAERGVWLRHLAAGGTVTELADRLGYSERAMYRLLRALYLDMGVQTRIEAVLRAQEAGWV